MRVIVWWWQWEEQEAPSTLPLSPVGARQKTYGWTSNSSLTPALLGESRRWCELVWFRLNSLAKHWILLIYNQVPKCRKIVAPDSHVERHAWDCKLRMSVHNATTLCFFMLEIILSECTVILIFVTLIFHSHNFETGDWQTVVRRLQAGIEKHIIVST